MKVKHITVEIRPLRESLHEFATTYRRIATGQHTEKREVVSFKDIDTMRKVLTPKRLELLKVIKHKKPTSVYALAKLTKRDAKSVNTDVGVLASLNMVKTKRSKTKRRESIQPQVTFDSIHLEITI